jgi:hypothetical protein
MLLLCPTTEGGEDGQERTKQGGVGRTASMVFGLALVMALVLPTRVIPHTGEDRSGRRRWPRKIRGCCLFDVGLPR